MLRAAAGVAHSGEWSTAGSVGAQTRVFDDRGRDCAGFWVRPVPGIATAKDEMPGQYCATLPPGRYRVVGTNHDGATASETVELRGEPTASITLRFAS